MAKENPAHLKYTATHEWVKAENNTATCGITDHAQELLTDIVFVELPAQGRQVKKGERLAVVESVKSVSDIYAPVTGIVTAVNDKLGDSPELVNKDAFGAGWMFKIECGDATELDKLLSRDQYEQSLRGD